MKDIRYTGDNLNFVIQELKKLDIDKDKRIKITEWSSKRSLPANAVYQGWYPLISDVLAMTIPEATRYVKYTFGLPILFADDYLGPIIGEGLNTKGFFQLSYEDKLLEMERLPVTRLFDTKMHNKLREELQHHFGNLGIDLSYK